MLLYTLSERTVRARLGRNRMIQKGKAGRCRTANLTALSASGKLTLGTARG